ncbi:unnamed protein product, partial [Microthlaspi erraticum]
ASRRKNALRFSSRHPIPLFYFYPDPSRFFSPDLLSAPSPVTHLSKSQRPTRFYRFPGTAKLNNNQTWLTFASSPINLANDGGSSINCSGGCWGIIRVTGFKFQILNPIRVAVTRFPATLISKSHSLWNINGRSPDARSSSSSQAFSNRRLLASTEI